MQNSFSFKLLPGCLNSRQLLELGLLVSDYSGFLDQQAIVRCNTVI